MQPLVNGQPGPDECWEELAEHSFLHDDLGTPLQPPLGARGTLRVRQEGPVTILLDGDRPLPGYPHRGERGRW